MTMKKLLLAAATVVAFATPSLAGHAECIVQKETQSMNRPEARYPEYRLPRFEKGDVVSIRDAYRAWDFVTSRDQNTGYGWVPHNVLGNCQTKEGTA